MRISERTRFPHPVLGNATGDYLSGEFSFAVTAVDEVLANDQVILEYTCTLTEPTLTKLVRDGAAAIGMFVTCLDTYFSRLVPLGLEGGRFSFDPGALVGRVEVQPLVWTRTEISSLPLENCHEEFGGGTMRIPPGEILAVDGSQVVNVGREKLAQMDTIFSIVEDPLLRDDELSVSLGSDRIQILVASNIHQKVNQLRERDFGHPIVLNGIYLPAVMEIIDALRSGPAEFEGRRWHRIFTAKCDHLGIDLRNPDLWSDAQKLLRSPFSEIRNTNVFWNS